MKKTVQTMSGPVFVAGKSKACVNPECGSKDKYYYASGVLLISLPYSTYGLDVLAFIGWQHEHEHKQLVEIQQVLNERGVIINERNVGKLYRQFLALLGGRSEKTLQQLESVVQQHGGVVWAIDALKPEGDGTLLYVLYEVLSGIAVSAIQKDHPTAQELGEWLEPYQALPYPVLATLSDGEEAIIAAMKKGAWALIPHQRCQEHWLSNVAEPVLKYDSQLRKQLQAEVGGLPAVPERPDPPVSLAVEAIASEGCVVPDRADSAGTVGIEAHAELVEGPAVELDPSEACAGSVGVEPETVPPFYLLTVMPN